MTSLVPRVTISERARKRLLWLSRSSDSVEDSRRPLLFSRLPRMLGPDGSTPESLQRTFEYIDQTCDRASAIVVSARRWRRALRRRGGSPLDERSQMP